MYVWRIAEIGSKERKKVAFTVFDAVVVAAVVVNVDVVEALTLLNLLPC